NLLSAFYDCNHGRVTSFVQVSNATFRSACRGGHGGPPSRRAASLSHRRDRKSTRLNSSHVKISYAVFCLKKKRKSHAPAFRAPRLPPSTHAPHALSSSLRPPPRRTLFPYTTLFRSNLLSAFYDCNHGRVTSFVQVSNATFRSACRGGHGGPPSRRAASLSHR